MEIFYYFQNTTWYVYTYIPFDRNTNKGKVISLKLDMEILSG